MVIPVLEVILTTLQPVGIRVSTSSRASRLQAARLVFEMNSERLCGPTRPGERCSL